MRQLPRNAVRGRRNVADLHTSGAAVGIDAAEPQMMLAGSIHLSLEASRQVLNGPTHELRVSVRCIERCIWGPNRLRQS